MSSTILCSAGSDGDGGGGDGDEEDDASVVAVASARAARRTVGAPRDVKDLCSMGSETELNSEEHTWKKDSSAYHCRGAVRRAKDKRLCMVVLLRRRTETVLALATTGVPVVSYWCRFVGWRV